MEYLVDGVPTDGLFLFLESLRLDGLHLFKKMFNGHGSCFLSLKSIHISHCPKLQSLFSLSMAWTLVQLEAITIESCEMMQEVIVDEGEAGRLQTNGSLFPRLRKLKLLGLSMLKSFCHAMNDLELPSLENLTLNGCNKMEEFSGGKLSMPVLRYVEIDFYIRETNGVNSIQHLFNDKRLVGHQSCPLPSQYQDQIVEGIKEEDCMGGPILSYPQRSSQASGGDIRENLLYGIGAKNFCSVSNKNMTKEHADSPESYLKDFSFFCSVLPIYYEFTKDNLVSQWMVGGLVELGEDKKMEEVCTECFDTLVRMDYIVPLRYDYTFDQMKYKIGDEVATFLQKQQLEPKFGKYSDREGSYTTKVEHMSISFNDINHVKLGVLKQYSRLQTLVIRDCYGVDRLPPDFFRELGTLKILNLSHTNITVLPSSITNLKELRCFDMSKTPIDEIPQAVFCFSHLQTVNLDGCLQLWRLPQNIDELINLRHLIVDVRPLKFMPAGIGKLSNMQTLNAFMVGLGDGGCVSELKELNKLKGSFCLTNLENVGSKEKASEACLYKKVELRKIRMKWSGFQHEESPREEEILESLQPPMSIQELEILFYSGGVLPSWISDPSFNELGSIFLHRCRFLCSLPSLGQLQSLESLTIIVNNEVVEIDSSFFRKQTNRDPVAFPKLKKLLFQSMPKLEKWTGFEDGDFPCLQRLTIEYCPRFVGIPFLSRLNHLSRLEIRYCGELSCLPEDGLPPSLELLMIKQTPKLKAQCCSEKWEDWSKDARVPTINIDGQQFYPKNGESVLG